MPGPPSLMELDLFAEALGEVDTGLLPDSTESRRSGLTGTKWLAAAAANAVSSALALPASKPSRRTDRSSGGYDAEDRIIELGRAMKFVASLLDTAVGGRPALVPVMTALQVGAWIGERFSSAATLNDDARFLETLAAIVQAVRQLGPGQMCIVPLSSVLIIPCRGGGEGSLSGVSPEEFVVGVVTLGSGMMFHPARPRSDGDVERLQPLVLGRVPREKLLVSTFWHLAFRGARRASDDVGHLYGSLLPFLSGEPVNTCLSTIPELCHLCHWLPVAAGTPTAGDAIPLVLHALEFILRVAGLTSPEAARLACVEPRLAALRQLVGRDGLGTLEARLIKELCVPSVARHAAQTAGESGPPSCTEEVWAALQDLERSAGQKIKKPSSATARIAAAATRAAITMETVRVNASSCEFPLWGLGLRGDALKVAEENAGAAAGADLVAPVDLVDVVPERPGNPEDLVQLLGRAKAACQRLQNQQTLLKCAQHLCFALVVHVFLCLPLDAAWYAAHTWRAETQQFVLEDLHALLRHLALAAVALGPAGDAGPRTVAAMVASVVFDAVARQLPKNVPSVLAQALCQGYGLGPSAFATESGEQAMPFPGLAAARAAVLEYFENSCMAGHRPLFQSMEVTEVETGLVAGCGWLLGLGPLSSRVAALLTGEDPVLTEQVPSLALLRDVAFLSQLLSRSGTLPFTAPKSGARAAAYPSALSWRLTEKGTFSVRGLQQDNGTPLEQGLPSSSKERKCTDFSAMLSRFRKGLLGLTGAERRTVAASQADPGALVGESLKTEEDVLFLPSARLRGFEGLSPGEAEVVLTMLLAPYLRIPLLLGYLGTNERIGALADERLQGVLDAAIFEPGPWRSASAPPDMPEELPAPTRAHLATPSGLLLNEFRHAPNSLLPATAGLLRCALERDTGRVAAAPYVLIFYAVRLGCRLLRFADSVLTASLPSTTDLRPRAPSGVYDAVLGSNRSNLEAATEPLRVQLRAGLKLLGRWAREAASLRRVALLCATWSHLAFLQDALGWGDGNPPTALIAAQLLLSMHGHTHAEHHPERANQKSQGTYDDPLGGAAAWEVFSLFTEQRTRLTAWLRKGGVEVAKTIEQTVAIAALVPEDEAALARKVAAPSGQNVGVGAPGDVGNSSKDDLQTWIEVRPGVFMRKTEAPPPARLVFRPGTSIEEHLRILASIPALAVDANLGSFSLQQGELHALPVWAKQCEDLNGIFGRRVEGLLASRVQRTEHRECLHLVSERHDLQHWTPDSRPWPLQTAARGVSCSWLAAAVQQAGGYPSGFTSPRVLEANDQLARLVSELPGIEVVVYQDPPTLHVFQLRSHARSFYRQLYWTSDTCWCLRDFPAQEPWMSETGDWSLFGGPGGALASTVQPPAAAPEATILISREPEGRGREALLPSELLRGLLPETILQNFRFWRGRDGIFHGEEREQTHQRPAVRLRVEPLPGDRAKVIRLTQLGDGEHAAQTLVNLMTSSGPLRRLAEMLTKLEDLAFVLVWAEGERISEVELPRLGLHFEADAHGNLAGRGMNGLRFATKQPPSRVQNILDQFGGAAALLEGPRGELAVVCSALARPRQPGSGPFPREWAAPLVFDRASFTGAGCKTETAQAAPAAGHYLFHVHHSYCYLMSPNLSAELYRLTCCWLSHHYSEIVRTAAAFGCDGLNAAEAAQWAHLGTETANDRHVDAQACRLHLSVAVLPLDLALPWNMRDAYSQFTLNRARCSANCILSLEMELQVLQLWPEIDGSSWLLRNRRRVLEAPSADVVVTLELPPLPSTDNYEMRVFSETATAADSWANALSVSSSSSGDEPSRCNVVAVRYIDQQLSHGELSITSLFEMLTHTATVQPLPEDPPHLVAACLARAYGPASAVIATLCRDESLCLALPKIPKKQGLLPTAAHRKWHQDVRERLVSAARERPFPEPPAAAIPSTEVSLQSGVMHVAWPLVLRADCDSRAVRGLAERHFPLQELAVNFAARASGATEVPSWAVWVLNELDQDRHCTTRGRRWIQRLQEATQELSKSSEVPILRHMTNLAETLERQLQEDRAQGSSAVDQAEATAGGFQGPELAWRQLQVRGRIRPHWDFCAILRLWMANEGQQLLATVEAQPVTLDWVAQALFLHVRSQQCISALAQARAQQSQPQGKAIAAELAKERYYVRPGIDGNGAILDPRLLAGEFLFGIMLRETQVEILRAFAGTAEARVHQMLMGGGKTCVIAPLAAALLSTPQRLFVAIVPASLLAFSRQQFRAKLSNPALGLPVLTFNFTRSTAVGPELLIKLQHARRRRSVVCMAPTSVKSLLLRVAELVSMRTLPDRPSSTTAARRLLKAVGLRRNVSGHRGPGFGDDSPGGVGDALPIAREALAVFRGSVALLDEIDWVLHPLKSELHWPCGPVRALDLADASPASLAEAGLRWRIMGALLEIVLSPSGPVHDLLHAAAAEHHVALRPNPVILNRRWYFHTLMPAVAKELISVFMSRRTPVPADELLEFLGPIGKCGATLRRLPDTEAKLVTLARQLLHSILPHILSLTHRVRYGLLTDDQVRSGVLTETGVGGVQASRVQSARRMLLAVPFVGKDCPTAASEFAHPDAAIGLSLLAYGYEGLRMNDFIALLRLLRAEMDEERGPHARRRTCLRWVEWVKEAGGRVIGFSWKGRLLADLPKDEVRSDAPPPGLPADGLEELRGNVWPLERVSASDRHQVRLLWQLMKRAPSAVKHYLYEHVFPEVTGLSDSLLSCTAQELGSDVLFGRRLGFSGTPSEVLPSSMGAIHYERGCDSRILGTLLSTSIVTNVEVLGVGWSPEWLLKRAGQGEHHALIDAGALIVGISNEEAAHLMLKDLPLSPFRGVVFLSAADECVVLLRDGRILPLAECGLAPDQRFTFYDHIHTTGLDVPQAPNACAALTLGKDVMWRDYAQAAFRMRGLGAGAQTLRLFVPPEVQHLITGASGVKEGDDALVDSTFPQGTVTLEAPKPDKHNATEPSADSKGGDPFDLISFESPTAPVAQAQGTASSPFDLLTFEAQQASAVPSGSKQIAGSNHTPVSVFGGPLGNSADHAQQLARILRWTGSNALASEVQQFTLLIEQNVEALWRRRAWAVVQGREAPPGHTVAGSLAVIRVPREDVIPNDPDPVVEDRTLAQNLAERLSANSYWLTPELELEGTRLVSEAAGIPGREAAGRGKTWAGSSNAIEQEQVQEQEEEQEEEQEHEQEEEQEEEMEQEAEDEEAAEQKYTRDDEGEVPWKPETLSGKPTFAANAPFYQCCDGLSVYNGKLMQAQKCLQYPHWLLASQNLLRQHFRMRAVKRLKNIILMLEWIPGVMPGQPAPTLEGTPPREALLAALRACELDGTQDVLTDSQVRGALECLHLNTSMCSSGAAVAQSHTIQSIAGMLEQASPICPTQPGRFFCLLSLFEAEHIRALLHMRPPFSLGVALRAPSVIEGRPLDESRDFVPGPAFQAYAAEHLCRFIDSEASFSAREMCAVDLCLASSSHDDRRAWWEQVRRCRRRAQSRPVPSLPVAVLLVPPEQRQKAWLESAISKVRATLRRRGMSVQQLFAHWAGRSSTQLSTAELAAGLQQLGFLDAVEAGRLANAAAHLSPKAGEQSGGQEIGTTSSGVSLAGFLKLMGSVPGETSNNVADEEEVFAATVASPLALEETLIRLDRGRWSVKLVSTERFSQIWSSARMPGKETRPFGIWRPDLRATAASGLHQGLRSLVGVGSIRPFLLGDLGVSGLDPPQRSIIMQVKAASRQPQGQGAGLNLDAWLARFLPRPVAFRLLWHDRRGATATPAMEAAALSSAPSQKHVTGSAASGEGLYVWRPVPPSDLFVALGAVVTTDSAEPRDIEVRCVPRAWLVRGDSLGPVLWSLGDRREVRVQTSLGGVLACPAENLKYLPSWAFISDHFYVGT